MKKNIFLILFLFSSITAIKAQIVVDANDFVNNPSKFNGKTIVLQGVIAQRSTNNSNATTVTPATSLTTPGAVNPPTPSSNNRNSSTPTNPAANSNPTAPVVRCSAPKNWERLEVQLPNNYDGCFVIFNKMANTVPMNKDVRMDITVKVDTRFMHRVTKIKVLP